MVICYYRLVNDMASWNDDGVPRSLFLAGLMVTSVMVGVLFFDIQKEGGNLAPVIEGDIPTNILIGSIDSLSLSITDEEMIELTLSVSLDGIEIQHQMDADGNLIIDISQLGVGSHAVKIVATDSIGQESKWSATFMIEYPDEGYTVIVVNSNEITVERGNSTTASGVLVHQSMDTCNLEWSDGNIDEFSLNLPYDEDGRFNLGFSNIQENLTITVRGTCGTWIDSSETEVFNITVTEPAAEPEPTRGCTDPEANNYDEAAEEDDGSCEYDEEPEPVVVTGSEEWWDMTLLCDDTDVGFGGGVDDYNTSGFDNHVCDVSYVIEDGNITISTNGLPNHDFHSGDGCCASSQTKSYTIPLEPIDDPDCNPSISTENCVMAPERGAVAVAVNGVAIYGPEDGPGGDAVAMHEGAYEEDRQDIWLGLCHGHSGPGGEYHYHADSNCMHWHPEGEQTWLNYSMESSRTVAEHSPIIGFALDGYSIYGFVGWDDDEEVVEMTSSYRLKDGETGYNGIDDYEYIAELGDLDSCNGHYAATPDWPEGIYHYHSTWENGEGGIGFPYFINCYRGELSSEGEDDPCAGGPPDGDVWGPGIGPPPEGCDEGPPPGGQTTEGLSLIALPYEIIPPSGGSIIAMLAMAMIAIRGLASAEGALDRVGTTRGYRPTPE